MAGIGRPTRTRQSAVTSTGGCSRAAIVRTPPAGTRVRTRRAPRASRRRGDPPLPASSAAAARVEQVLVHHDHVAGLGRDDVGGQRGGRRTHRAGRPDGLPELRVMRSGQHSEGAAVRANGLEVGQEADTLERQRGIRVPRRVARVPHALRPRREHGSAEQHGCHALETVEQRQAGRRRGGHHRHVPERDPAAARSPGVEPVAHDPVDFRCQRARIEKPTQHDESEGPQRRGRTVVQSEAHVSGCSGDRQRCVSECPTLNLGA